MAGPDIGQAIRYAQHSLKLHTAKDLERVKAEIRLRKLKAAQQKLTEKPPAPPTRPGLRGR